MGNTRNSKADSEIKEMIRLYTQEAQSAPKISAILGIPRRTVSRRLRDAGIRVHYGSFISKALKGMRKTEEHKRNLSLSRIAGNFRGERHPNWKGGKCDWSILRYTQEYITWRKSVFSRDNFTCRMCGKPKGGKLQAHHIVPRSKFPLLTFNVDNGVTLCTDCHNKTIGKEHLFLNAWKQAV